MSIALADGWRARARAGSAKMAPAERRAFLNKIPRDLNSAGFRQAELPERDHWTLRGWFEPADVMLAVRELDRLRHRLPMRASDLQMVMLDGLERGAILAAAVRIGLRIERVAPGSVDGIVYPDRAESADLVPITQPAAVAHDGGSFLRIAKAKKHLRTIDGHKLCSASA